MKRISAGIKLCFAYLVQKTLEMAAKSVVHSLAWCAWSGRQMTSRVCRHVEAQARLGTGTCRRSFLTASARLTASRHVLTTTEDRYNAIHVNLPPDISVEEFDTQLETSLKQWRTEGRCAVWLTVPIELSHLIPAAARHGLEFHHAEGATSTLCRWLKADTPNMLPRFATHQVGVAGCVVREDTKEVLVIQDRNRTFQLWKFPGGLGDLGEDLGTTAEREVFEETGIKSEFQGILTFRQQHKLPNAFGRSDLYFLCYMKPLTLDLDLDHKEILGHRWLKLENFKHEPRTSATTHRVLQLLSKGLEIGFDKVVLQSVTLKSIFKGTDYKLNHANVGLKGVDPKVYAHYMSSAFPF